MAEEGNASNYQWDKGPSNSANANHDQQQRDLSKENQQIPSFPQVRSASAADEQYLNVLQFSSSLQPRC